jgi:hypothetical protein
MRADDSSVITSGRGRKSVRISSKKTYGSVSSSPSCALFLNNSSEHRVTQSVVVIDLDHMPQGCGTWPAFWTVTPSNWPTGGEIDIIEGANDQGPNLSSLHTTADCSMSGNRQMTG